MIAQQWTDQVEKKTKTVEKIEGMTGGNRT